jgi:uncharacterized protein with FMN-binding domain
MTIIGLIVLVSLFLGFLGYQYLQLQNTPAESTTTSQKTGSSSSSSGSTSQSTLSTGSTQNSGSTTGTATTTGTASSAKTTTGTTSTAGTTQSATTGSAKTTTGTTGTTSTAGTTQSATSSGAKTTTTTTTSSSFYKDGVYSGSGNGKTQGMRVQVVVSGGKINGVSVLTSRDDQPYLNEAIQGLVPRIIAAQSATVDTVSGATLSSKGILQGTAAALAQAK